MRLPRRFGALDWQSMENGGLDGLADLLGGFDFKRILGVADALPMPLALLDRDQRYLFCNQALADFDAATQQHGMVTPGGVVGSTGVTGNLVRVCGQALIGA